jgi:hypothetical protein
MPNLESEMGCRPPVTTQEMSKAIDDIWGRVKELNLIISDINNELFNVPMETSNEPDVCKKASKGWLEDEYELLLEIRTKTNIAIDKINMLKSRVRGEK